MTDITTGAVPPRKAPGHACPAVDDGLPLPDHVVPGQVLWPYAISIGAFHVLALAVFLPWCFTWPAVLATVVGVFVFGQGINLCYHRLLAHRSFLVPRWLERFFVIIALCCLQDTPAKWVAIHRFHHNHADHQPDPHSPLVSFLWGHIGWLVVRNQETLNIGTYRRYASDILGDPFYLRLEKSLLWIWIYVAHALLFVVAGAVIGRLAGGDWATGWRYGISMLTWAVILRTVMVWHITWSVNSLTHLFGYQRSETGENSRNNWLVALLAVGEGWHNNHHHDPASATNQHRWWEIDLTYAAIRGLEIVGLATRVTKPRHQRHAARTEAGGAAGADENASAKIS
jgi:stearoyl-CoA desaturase (delta-9 desaturase)